MDLAPLRDRGAQPFVLGLEKGDADGFAPHFARPHVSWAAGAGAAVLRVAFAEPVGPGEPGAQAGVIRAQATGWFGRLACAKDSRRANREGRVYRPMSDLPFFTCGLARLAARCGAVRAATLCEQAARFGACVPATRSGRPRPNKIVAADVAG